MHSYHDEVSTRALAGQSFSLLSCGSHLPPLSPSCVHKTPDLHHLQQPFGFTELRAAGAEGDRGAAEQVEEVLVTEFNPVHIAIGDTTCTVISEQLWRPPKAPA